MLPSVCRNHHDSTRGIVSQYHRQMYEERISTLGDGAAYDTMMAKARVRIATLEEFMVEYVGCRLMDTSFEQSLLISPPAEAQPPTTSADAYTPAAPRSDRESIRAECLSYRALPSDPRD